MAAKQVKMSLTKVKDTKNMVQYQEDTDSEKPISLYLRKDQVESVGSPDKLNVVITAGR